MMNKRNALIFGATGGIGSAICQELHDRNYNCWLVSRSPEKTGRLRSRLGVPADNTFCIPSITTVDGFGQTRQWLESRKVQFSAAIHCVGYGILKRASDINPDEWQSLMDINLNSAFSLYKLAWEFRVHGQLDMVFFGSASTDQEWPKNSLYGASKAGLQLFCSSLQKEVRAEGSRVWLYRTGSVDTAFFNQLPNHLPREKMIRPEVLARLVVDNLDVDRSVYFPEIVIRSD